MRKQWKSVVMIAALALSIGIAAPAWSRTEDGKGLADPMAEDYAVHVIPFYKIDANWSAFLVVADSSFQDLKPDGSPIGLWFYDAACNLVSDARVEVTRTDAQYFQLHSDTDANGQFNGLPGEGVVLLDGFGKRFLTYILLVNGNNNSLIRIDSIPCKGPDQKQCYRDAKDGTWLRYNTFNTVAATFGDSGDFRTNLYFFSARGELRQALLAYGTPRHGDWANRIAVYGYCDEIFLGSRYLDLECTQRLRLSSLNFTFLNMFPNEECAEKPGHIETFATNDGIDVAARDYSGFQETIGAFPPAMLIGTGYTHHSD